MFDTIANGFRAAQQRLTGEAELTEEVIDAALKDVRMSLLEADVEFRVVKKFLRQVKENALGETVQLVAKAKESGKVRVRPADHFVQICHDALIDLMGPVDTSIASASKGVTGIMMVGLQGSGKTTSTGKLARKLSRDNKKVLLVAADVYRPAAVTQLQVLGEKIDVPVFAEPGGDPVDICQRATQKAAEEGFDYIIYDTAGRLTVDDELMVELEKIKGSVHPANIFLVVDAMIGQEAVNTARAFDERIDISGVILTKLDGDARGGAALSIKAATGKPIKFLGMGETLEKLDDFRPEGLASRILGMGDIVGLMTDFQEAVDEEQATKDAEKMLGGGFTMDDFLNQIRTLQKMGSMKDLMDKLPIGQMFGGSVPDDVMAKAGDDRELVKIQAIIQSMTKKERADPELFFAEGSLDSATERLTGRKRKSKSNKPKDYSQLGSDAFVESRVQRVARGCGQPAEEIQGLIGRFMMMRDMMGMLGGLMGGGGMLDKIPGMGKMKQLNAMRKMANDPQAMQAMMGGAGGGMPGMPGMPGMGGGMPGMPGMGGGLPGMPGLPGLGGSGGQTKARDTRKEKAKRKRDKAAKRKNRKR